jgi:hypothetical protein
MARWGTVRVMGLPILYRSISFALPRSTLHRARTFVVLGTLFSLAAMAHATEPISSVETTPQGQAAPIEIATVIEPRVVNAVDGEVAKLSDASSAQALASVRYLASIGLRHVPQKFDGKKHWGDTKKVWAGVDVDLEDGKLKSHRRYRDVEHGRWMQYEVSLPEPGLVLDKSVWINHATNYEFADDTQVPHKRECLRIDATVITPATYEVRIQRWNYGVRMTSVTVKGRLNLRLDTLADVRIDPDYSEVPPAIQITPKILSAKISIDQFEVERVSRIGGDVAELWGDIVKELFTEKLVDAQNDKLVDKLNRSIDKNRDDLRISMATAIQKGLGVKP